MQSRRAAALVLMELLLQPGLRGGFASGWGETKHRKHAGSNLLLETMEVQFELSPAKFK